MLRVLLAIVVLNAAGFLAVGTSDPVPAPTPGQQKIPVPIPNPPVDPKMPYFLVCAKECDDCARICDTCSAHCAGLVAKGNKEHLATLKLCQDCAEICSATARVTARDGPMSGVIAGACADACKQCGDACEKHAADPMMKKCAEECRRCEKVCREMVQLKKAVGEPEKEKEPKEK